MGIGSSAVSGLPLLPGPSWLWVLLSLGAMALVAFIIAARNAAETIRGTKYVLDPNHYADEERDDDDGDEDKVVGA